MNTLIATVGLPRSGKSTWAKQTGLPIVSTDAIRMAQYGRRFWAPGEKQVWATAQTMVRSLFLAGHNEVCLDSTAITHKLQDNLRYWGDDYGDPALLNFDVKFVVFTTSPNLCKVRAIDDGQSDLVPVIDKMLAKWEIPTQDVWDVIFTSDGQIDRSKYVELVWDEVDPWDWEKADKAWQACDTAGNDEDTFYRVIRQPATFAVEMNPLTAKWQPAGTVCPSRHNTCATGVAVGSAFEVLQYSDADGTLWVDCESESYRLPQHRRHASKAQAMQSAELHNMQAWVDQLRGSEAWVNQLRESRIDIRSSDFKSFMPRD